MKYLKEIFNSAIITRLRILLEIEKYANYKNAYNEYLNFLQKK